MTMDTVEAIFKTQVDNRWRMSQTTAKERKAYLIALKNKILERREDIKAALYADFKKPYAETELTEIHTVLDEINFALKKISKWMKPKKVPTPITLMGSKSFIKYEAKGVVLVLAPWNYPFSLLINPVVAALAAGNCVIARPSEKTPATGEILKEIIEACLPANVVKVVIGDIDLSNKLLEFPFDHIFFTGSIPVGKIVMAAAAKNLTPVTLELGGKSPVIVDREVDLKDCVQKVLWGKYINGGQTCVAPDYLFLPEELKPKFIELFSEELERKFGETSNERFQSKDFARMVDKKAYGRLVEKIKGEKTLLEDHPLQEDRFIPPTLLTDAHLNSAVMEDEIFGPILPILTYKSIDTVIDYVRSHDKPLALYVFSKSRKMIKRILNSTTSGGAVINHVVLHLANPHLPFGGVGHSGMGNYHGEFGFRTFSHERAVLKQGRFSLTPLYFPPYGSALSKLAFRLLRWFE
jgi:aldehyde dehydrogenase (NAD+)